jgi:hypothetical protein
VNLSHLSVRVFHTLKKDCLKKMPIKAQHQASRGSGSQLQDFLQMSNRAEG